MKACSTIYMTEEDLHKLIITAGQVAYDRCQKGQSWEKTQMELIDGIVLCTRQLTDEDMDELGIV